MRSRSTPKSRSRCENGILSFQIAVARRTSADGANVQNLGKCLAIQDLPQFLLENAAMVNKK
jgi:hypothetical protein